MDETEIRIHYAAARHYGRAAACGEKIDYGSEPTADKAAAAMSQKSDRALEAYPCGWCFGWHIGRAMTAAEREQFSAPPD